MSGPPHAAGRPRGEPLLVLGLVFGGWLAVRAILWQSPFGVRSPSAMEAHAAVAPPIGAAARVHGRTASLSPVARPIHLTPAGGHEALPKAPRLSGSEAGKPLLPVPPTLGVGSQQMLLAAVFAHMELAPEPAARTGAERSPAAAGPGGEVPLLGRASPRPANGEAWSGDAWLLWRDGRAGPLAAGRPTYGRSQAGAVLRYRLAPQSRHRPTAYARATRALAGARESEVAVGVALRPLGPAPISLAGEVRVSEGRTGREARPAAFAVTELPPLALPLALRAEIYAQAGYVGGRFATAFVDGQARIDAGIARFGQVELRAGGGVWGGAQKGAARLDAGPSATASFALGETRARLALDYRLRVAGDAAPKSGPSLTISAGF